MSRTKSMSEEKRTLLFVFVLFSSLAANATLCLWLFTQEQWASMVVIPLMFVSSGITTTIIVWSAYRLKLQ